MLDEKKFFAIRGYMKSGTNWTGRLLNLHPQISCTGEFHWERITGQLIQTFSESENLHSQQHLLDAVWQHLDRFIKLAMIEANDSTALWIGDRTPSHIEPSIIIGARNFNLIRDGRDVVVSAAYHFFNNPEIFPEFNTMDSMKLRLNNFRADPKYFLNHTAELLANDEFVRAVAFHWSDTVRKNQEKIERSSGLVSLEVRYEEVHRDTEAARRRMYEFLEVDPEAAAPLAFNTLAGFSEEKPTRFLRKGVVGDWMNYFTPRTKSVFDEIAGATLVQLGYVESANWKTVLK